MERYSKDICALVLSAGKGTRMKSPVPKVLHKVLNEPILWYVFVSLERYFKREDIFFVIGYMAELIEDSLEFIGEQKIYQYEQLGTGHALRCACPVLKEKGYKWVLVVNGDVPLLDMDKILPMIEASIERNIPLSFLTIELDNPHGYGRVIRDERGQVKEIVEQKDITDKSLLNVREVNAGVYFLNIDIVEDYLFSLKQDNSQGEYYITDLVELLIKDKRIVFAYNIGKEESFLGVNSPEELSLCDEILRKKIIDGLLKKGVLIYSPHVVRIGPKVIVEEGVEIVGPCEIYGSSHISRGSIIDSNTWILDGNIGEEVRIYSFSHIEGACIESGCKIGPFARLRPDTHLKNGVKVGNFVEIKKSVLESGVKASHLSYLGDSHIGENTNIGAGTITCNYDGKQKHRTTIGKSVFVGSNTSLVAPLTIGDNALIGAGSTITKDVPPNSLAVARGKQKNLDRRKR